MTTTGTAAYARFNLGFLDARVVYALAQATPARSAELAERLAVDRAAISRAVSRLTAQGRVVLGPKRRLLLTPEGQDLAVSVAEVFEERCLALTAGIADDERDVAMELLRRLQENLRPEASTLLERAALSLEGSP